MDMKMNIKNILFFASLVLAASACEQEIEQVKEPDVTPTVLAGNEMAARLPKVLDLGWNKDDKLTVIGSSSQEFSILDDYAVSFAKFKGEALEGESFTIIKSRAGNTLEAVEARDYSVQEQKADGSMEHLDFDLALVGVSDYKDVVFSSEWAEENGGELKMNGVLKLELSFPSQILTLRGIGLKADRNVFYGTNSASSATDSLYLAVPDVDVSVKDGKFTAYMLTSWQNVEITDQDEITVWAHYGDKSFFTVLPAQNRTISAGSVNEISIEDMAWEIYDMSPGSKINPYQIRTKEDLKSVSAHLEAGYTKYFNLMADIDLQGEEWTPLNTDATAYKGMIFEGNNHKISNLTLDSDAEYASFAGVLMGSFRNVTFENPSVTSTIDAVSSVGVLAGYAGWPAGDAQVEIENVNVTGASLTVTGGQATPAGIIAGTAKNAIVTNCHVKGNVSHAAANAENNIGGFIGNLSGGTVTGCSIEGDVEVTSVTRVIGGFIGSIRATSTVTGCSQKGDITAPGTIRYSGLCIGLVAASNTVVKDCKAEGEFSGVDDNCGGFLGCVFKNISDVTIDNCDARFTMTFAASGKNVGGIVGLIQAPGVVVRNCDSQGDMHVAKSIDQVGGVVGFGDTPSTGLLIERCSYDGYMGKKDHNRSIFGGIIGYMAGGGSIVRNCWSAGEIDGANHSVGGICGTTLPNTVIECCYSTMEILASHGVGGIVGRAENHENKTQATEDKLGNKVSRCIAWNPSITSRKKPLNTASNHSCAAVVGKTVKFNIMENNYRRADMVFDVYNNETLDTLFDMADSNAETALVWNYDAQYYCPYHGKAASADATVSSVAKSLGWDETVWDLSGALPALK